MSAETESNPQGSAETAEQNSGFDARLERLEAIVVQLEQGGLELEPAIEQYKEGVALLKGCRDLLGRYRRQVEELSREAEASLSAYEADPDVAGPAGRGG
ncbi:MAG: exodeoxyribonuclease VII small subunit [bacterium]|nr:exodeoxyribonuclease VII small subunit [bacterium]